MSRRLVVPVLALGAVALVAVPPASAKHKKISKEYQASAFPPDPSHAAVTDNICEQTIPGAGHQHTFKAPEAGTITINMNGFVGDWDLALRNDKGQHLADSAQQPTEPVDRPEKIKYKVKKAMSLVIVACNFSGGPTAEVSYVFEYAR